MKIPIGVLSHLTRARLVFFSVDIHGCEVDSQSCVPWKLCTWVCHFPLSFPFGLALVGTGPFGCYGSCLPRRAGEQAETGQTHRLKCTHSWGALNTASHLLAVQCMPKEEGPFSSCEHNIDAACNSFSFAITLLCTTMLWWQVSLFRKNYSQAI